MAKRPNIPVDGSWRMIEGGENDSFDTSVVHGDDQDPFTLSPLSSPGHPGVGRSQESVGGSQHSFGGSQDSIGDFMSKADDERVILRSPFPPSLPAARRTPTKLSPDARQGDRTPDPEFFMPTVEVEGRRRGLGREGGYNLRRRAPRSSEETGSPLKRRVRAQYVYEDEEDERDRTVGERVAASIPNAALDVLSWFFGVIAMAFRYAQRPLALVLAVYFFCGALIMLQNMLTKSLFVSLSPLCRIPGASYLDLPFCPQLAEPEGGKAQDGGDGGTGHVEFDDLMAVQAQFEHVLERSADSVSLPLEMKRSESSIRDLRTMVRYSELSAREELTQEFDGYIDAARSSTSELQRFNTHVGSTVDSIISVNRWMARYLDSVEGETSADPRGLIWSWTDWVFAPFQPAMQSDIFDERALRDRYVEHTTLLSDRISGLVLEATAILRNLGRAESHLNLIYEISTRSEQSVRSRRDQILYTLWTLLGANSRALGSLNGQLALLKHVERQRSAAVAQLSALVVDLERIEANLADLRERVAEPELASRGGGRPVPLAVHVETIDRGVERLDDARRRLRAVENERIREALARGGVANEKLLEGR